MSVKLKKGYFRVFPFNPYVPLTGKWTAVEQDNAYGIYKDNSLVKSYSGQAYGFGKVLSIFNEEFVVYMDGTGIAKYVTNSGTSGNLVTANTKSSVVCFGDCFVVCSLNSANNAITCTKYVIAGVHSNPFAHAVSTQTLSGVSITGMVQHLESIKISDTEAYIAQLSTNQCVKISKGENWTSDDLSITKVSGTIKGSETTLPLPRVGAIVLNTNTTRVCYNRNLDFYCTIVFNGERPGYNTSVDLTIYRASTNAVIYSGNIVTGASGNGTVNVRVLVDNDGNGYVVMTYSTGTSNSSAKVFRLSNGTLSQVASTSASGGSGQRNGSGIMALVNNIIPPLTMYSGGSVRKKVSFTTSSASVSDANNTDVDTFGSAVLELD
jgi:hypothetical protein